jgi:16S rRNA G966 N2-methylase RsmD
MKSYANIIPIETPVPAERQSAKRHYGVHPYFTRRPANVVRKYILHYSKEGDRILDPFGGSGVTAIEAFLENRVGIQNDINPLANFVAQGIVNLAKGDLSDYRAALVSLREVCQAQLDEILNADEARLNEILSSLKLPENVPLPSNSDVAHYYDLFTPRQLASLAVLKDAIERILNQDARNGMVLAWSATLGKLNKTFLSAEGRAESRGGSSIFSIYRYKVAKKIVELPPWPAFLERANNVLEAKAEIDKAIELKKRTTGWSGAFETYAYDIDDLSEALNEKVDYIFTDPPYGGHISYLDLSTLWNAWLGSNPSLEVREKELIVGGELKLTEDDYTARLGKSIKVCTQLLKQDRWLSVVFQHWNTNYFEAILAAATEEGAELKTAISQVGDPIWSMHKKKNKESVLAGELILTFHKSGKRVKLKRNGHFDVSEMLHKILSRASSGRLYGEYLFNELVIEAWNNASINSLNINRTDFIEMVESYGWRYDANHHYWTKEKVSEPSLFGSD